VSRGVDFGMIGRKWPGATATTRFGNEELFRVSLNRSEPIGGVRVNGSRGAFYARPVGSRVGGGIVGWDSRVGFVSRNPTRAPWQLARARRSGD
jgi:hypothetical protein